jgi:uncharacterized protein
MIIKRILRRLFARTSKRSSALKLLLVLGVLLALPALAYWRGIGTDAALIGANASEMVVEKIEPAQANINLVLKEKTGPRRMVVAVGQTEAFSINDDLNLGFSVPTVTAYAVTRQIVDQMGGKVERVVVNNASEKELFAKIVLSRESGELAIDATPSDAIALAVKAKAPIYVDLIVLDRVGVVSGR